MSGAGSTHHNVRSISSIPDTDSVRSTSRPVSRTESSRFENDIHRPSLPRVVNNDERPSTAGSARFNKESIPFHRPTPSQAMPKRPENSKQKRNDEYVMDTNNSSIVSKRSVEKLYYGGEQEYFRYFVSKFKRRSPLINRGYWLRMKAIDSTVRRFLSEQTHKRKIVVNLGCGYDPLPFELLGKQPDLCANATFVDVDFPPLMRNKCGIIEHTEQLSGLLDNFYRTRSEDGVLGAGNPYLAVGCDLRNIDQLQMILQDAVDIDEDGVAILFVAEVSMAYMEPDASQALLEWTATYQDVRFCLLEALRFFAEPLVYVELQGSFPSLMNRIDRSLGS